MRVQKWKCTVSITTDCNYLCIFIHYGQLPGIDDISNVLLCENRNQVLYMLSTGILASRSCVGLGGYEATGIYEVIVCHRYCMEGDPCIEVHFSWN